MHMRHIVICGLSQQYFSTLSHKRHDYKKVLNIKCVWFSLQRLIEPFFILSETYLKSDSLCKVPVIIVRF
jgi:hypothetical protein